MLERGRYNRWGHPLGAAAIIHNREDEAWLWASLVEINHTWKLKWVKKREQLQIIQMHPPWGGGLQRNSSLSCPCPCD